MTKQEAIKMVNESVPSIWSREDVLGLIEKIESGGGFDPDNLIDKVRDSVKSAVEDMSTDDVVDTDDATYDIRGGNEVYVSDISIRHDNVVDEIMEWVVNAVNDYVDELEEAK